MSKKKNKFQKQLKAQFLQEISQTPAVSNKTAEPAKVVFAPASSREVIADLPQIKYDLKKTGVVVLSLAVMMAALAILDIKYGILLKLGDQLFKVFNIN